LPGIAIFALGRDRVLRTVSLTKAVFGKAAAAAHFWNWPPSNCVF